MLNTLELPKITLNLTTLTQLSKNLKLIKYDLHTIGLSRLTLVGDLGSYSITIYKYPEYQVFLDYWSHNTDEYTLLTKETFLTLENVLDYVNTLVTLIKRNHDI